MLMEPCSPDSARVVQKPGLCPIVTRSRRWVDAWVGLGKWV